MFMKRHGMKVLSLLTALMFYTLLSSEGAFALTGVWAEKAPQSVIDNIDAGEPRDIIVLFDDTGARNEAAFMRDTMGLAPASREITDAKADLYNWMKQDVISNLPQSEYEILKDYSHLPMVFMRIDTIDSLWALLEHADVVKVYEESLFYPILTQSLPLINQPAVEASGKTGTGTAVAVLDTGVDYTRPAFGPCASPGSPAGCKVIYAQDFAPDDGSLDDNGHGTNVSGIALGVAPDTGIAALDVFDGPIAWSSDIIDAINWCIANKSVYNIEAINLSLGDGAKYTATCPGNVFTTPIANAKSAGILSSIASGNEGYTDGLSSPACVPAAVSVGAVYDSDLGSLNWGSCTDSVTYADKVTCFSNSSSFLTMLTPGALITAAGYTMGGTSQAAPHVAGAIAVLRGAGAFPSDTVDQTVARMTDTGVPVTDTKNSITKPRLDLLTAIGGGTTYSISGNVRKKSVWGGGTPLAGVTMTLSGGATTTTDSIGNYIFTGLSDGSYTVTPSLSGYTFTPPGRNPAVSGADVTGQNFTGTYTGVQTHSISGNVRKKSVWGGGTPLAGVTMTLSGGATTTTDSIGNYIFTGLSDGSYTVTPSLSGYKFTPPGRNPAVSGADVTGQNFTGSQ